MAADAAHDPTVTQALASRGKDLPERYQGETPSPVPPAAASAAEAPPPSPAPIEPEPTPAGFESGLEPISPAIPSDVPNGIRAFRPGDLTIDADRFQFKAGGDEAGVTDRLQGVTNWDPVKAGLSLVWEDNGGQHFIVDGHQRYGLAQRIADADPAQDPKLNSIVVREADGVSDIEARAMAAAKNIAEGTGTAIDAAKVLRDQPELIKDLPPRSELVRQAGGLANLADEPFRAIVNQVVPPNYGAIVGRLAPEDPKLQGALVDLLAKTEPANATQAEAIVRQGMAAGTRTETQASLFGDQEIVSSLYADRAKVLDRSLRELKRDQQVFSTLVRDQDIVQAVGNRLEASANAQRLAADQQAVQILQILANRRGALSDALSAAARRAADGDSGGAVRDFVAAIRSQAESGDLVRAADGLGRGRVEVAGEDAAHIVDPSAPIGSPAAEQRAAGDAAAVVAETQARTPVVEQTDQGAQLVMPGAERSAQQAMAAREAAGHGRIAPPAPQAAPGGMFVRPEPGQPGFEWGPETGAVAWGGKPPPAPGSLEEAQQSILSKLSIGQAGPRRPFTLSRLYTAIFDKLYPISEAMPGGIATSANPYRLSRLLAGEAGKIEHFLTRNTFDFHTYEPNGPSLQDVLAPVKDDLDNFRAFAAAARGLELEARGITTGLDLAAMRHVAREGIAKYEPVLTGLVDYQNRVAAYLRDAGVLSREGYAAMTEANQLYVPFQRVMEENYQPATGGSLQARNPIHRIEGSEREIVDPIESVIRNTAAMITMADRNEAGNALVTMLTREGQIGIGARQPIAAIELPPDPELDAALRSYLERNGVKDPSGLLDLLHAAASPPEDAGTIGVFRNGVRHTYEVDPDIARAWKGLDASSAGLMEKILRPFASTLRAGAVLTPDFALRHTIRDFLYAAVTSPGLYTPADMARGFMGLINKDEDYWRWLQGGGANISMVSVDRRYLQDDIARLTDQTGLMTRAINVVADPNASWMQKGGAVAGLPFRAAGKYLIHPLQVLTELAENASHLGAFKKSLRSAEQAGADISKPEIQEAAFASRDIAVDAARIGAKTRAYNMITAFSNIVLQDSDRVARAFVNDPVGTSLKIGGGIALPSALLWWAQRDDPRYHELPQWERDLFWVVLTDKWEDVGPAAQYGPPQPGTPYRVQDGRLQLNNGTIFRIPKPWGMGVLFGTGTERALEAFAAHNPDAFRHWGNSIADAVIPSFVPTAAGPILNQWTNRDTFTNRTLIPDQMEKWLPEYQYTPYTTEAAKALGKIVGAFPGLRTASIAQDSPIAGGVARALTSPILLENYVRGWSGNLGVYALNLADAALRKSGELPDPTLPTATLADIPVVKAFVARYPTATTQSIQDFEDSYRANKVYYDTWIAKAKDGDAEAAQRIQRLGGPRMFVNLDGIEKALQEHNKLIRDVYKNPQMTPSDKRQLIDTVYYRMIELGQAGKAALQRVDAALGPRGSVH
ncbi:MAG: LPD38 domain-containing protein [Stellaceae bacterium]